MPTRKTIFWLLAAAALYFIAWNVGSGWLYILSAFVLAVPVASLALARFNTRNLDVQLSSSAEAIQGGCLLADVTITNRSWLPRFLIKVDLVFAGSRSSILAPDLSGRHQQQACLQFSGVRRGVYPGAAVKISSSAPFGIASSKRRRTAERPLVVFPRSFFLGSDWAAGQGSAGYMLASSVPTRKPGGDYLGVRDYHPEDSPRSIHWRTTARTGSLAVVEYAHQVAINPVVLVDNWRDADFGAGEGSSFETAVSIAASLINRESMHNRRFAIGSSWEDAAVHGMSNESREALLWLSGVQADRPQPLGLSAAQLPWPSATPVLIMASHVAYADLASSEFLNVYPHSVIVMLDWRAQETDRHKRSLMMEDNALGRLADEIDAQGGRCVLIDAPDQVVRCLTDL